MDLYSFLYPIPYQPRSLSGIPSLFASLSSSSPASSSSTCRKKNTNHSTSRTNSTKSKHSHIKLNHNRTPRNSTSSTTSSITHIQSLSTTIVPKSSINLATIDFQSKSWQLVKQIECQEVETLNKEKVPDEILTNGLRNSNTPGSKNGWGGWILQAMADEFLSKRSRLSHDEEKALSSSIQRLMEYEKCREMNSIPRSDVSLWKSAVGFEGSVEEFQKVLNEGIQAKNTLIESNIGLVVWIANKKRRRIGHLESVYCDLVQDGILGLIRAAELFDGQRGHRFSTYATWHVRQAVSSGLSVQLSPNSAPFRIPLYQVTRYEKLKSIANTYSSEDAESEMSLSSSYSVAELSKRSGFSVSMIQELRNRFQRAWSLDASMKTTCNSGEDLSLQSFLGASGESPETFVDSALLREELELLMIHKLSSFEEQVIRLRFGLCHHTRRAPMSTNLISKNLNVPFKRVLSSERKALRILRKHLGCRTRYEGLFEL
mmetsp:Transcript_8968/g.16153  ORF Transcript_8968/g.16153 Transcript_8968/m.16153 type:complete len:487 (+) Transcript_8968:45-1505(+)